MGAWGTGPFQNDTAGDALDRFFTTDHLDLFITIRDLINDEDPMVFRAGAELLIAALDKRLPTLRDKVLQRLEELGKNKEFIEEWNEPNRIRKAVRSQHKRLGRKE